MKKRKSDIEDLVTGFVASIQTLIGRWRQINGTDALRHFEAAVESERQRYQRKFEALRTDESCAGLGDVIDATERQINQIATNEISRVNGDGKIEFNNLIAQRAINDAVDQLKGKQTTREEGNV